MTQETDASKRCQELRQRLEDPNAAEVDHETRKQWADEFYELQRNWGQLSQ